MNYYHKYCKYKKRYINTKSNILIGGIFTNKMKQTGSGENNHTDIISGWGTVKIGNHKIIKDNYKIISKIGEGAFGVVSKAIRKKDNKIVVIKEQTPEIIPMLKYEINALIRATKEKCTDIVQLYDVIYDGTINRIYYIMEFIEGYGLDLIINKFNDSLKNSSSNQLKEDQYCETLKRIFDNENKYIDIIINPLVRGIRCLHNNKITHNDIKPDNLILDIKLKKARILDLGTGCVDDCLGMSGLADYNSDEVYNNKVDPDNIEDWKKGDIWSLGQTIYELSIGRKYPHPEDRKELKLTGDKLLETMGKIFPNEFKCVTKLILGLLEKDPIKRWNNWLQLTTDNGVSELCMK